MEMIEEMKAFEVVVVMVEVVVKVMEQRWYR